MGRDDPRVRRIKEYALARLRHELANAPRGAQARLAKRLGVSGAHLSNMLSTTPSRQPGEDFRRKVAAHWGISYAQLEALALGEDMPATPRSGTRDVTNVLPNLSAAIASYDWMSELPADVRPVIREQARQHFAYLRVDLPVEEWQRVLTGLEREALSLLARRTAAEEAACAAGTAKARKRRSK